MSGELVGIDPAKARELAGALRGAAGTAQHRLDRLADVIVEFELEGLSAARDHLLDFAEDAEAAAADFDARADLAEAIDAGDWAAVFAELVPAVLGTEAGWEAETTGGPDDSGSVPVTVSSWDSVADRIVGASPSLPGWLCAAGAWYRQRGTLIGPDGQAYPLLIPQVVSRDAGEDEPALLTEDWGRPDDVAISDLDGIDPGWTTVALERGIGRIGDDLSIAERFWIGLSGAAGVNVLGADGLRPAPLSVYEGTTLDGEFNPNYIPAGEAVVAGPPDAVDEVSATTPRLVADASGRFHYEMTVPSTNAAVVMGGAAELVNHVATGMDNVAQIDNARNVGFVVEYQTNHDGRTRAIVHAHQIQLDEDGEPVVFAGYGGLDAEGEPGIVDVVSPRLHDEYTPTYPTNGIDPG